MGETIRMTMDDGAAIAVYHAQPEGERRGGLVLIQEIFGVTDHIRELCDEYAADGYEVLAPALFDREHPGFESDYSGPQFERAVELARELHPFGQSLKDAQACIDALKAKGPVFITGYCYGGSVAWRMAQISPDLAAASAYYGSLVPTQFADEAPGCATIAHFGRYDAGIPMEGVEALIAKDHPTAQVFVYDANHGFNSDRRKDYHEASSELARERTLMLFRACGGVTVVRVVLFGLLVIAALAAAAGAMLYFNQQNIFYPAPRDYPRGSLPGYRIVHTETSDGLRLKALYRAAQPGRRTIIFFHGNGDSLAGAAEAMRGLAADGNGVLLVEYRGYGGNPGSPGEAGFYRDGEAAMRWLASEGVAASQTILVGNSIGSGPATEMATRHPVAALILVSGFSSLPDVAGAHVRWLPVRWLVRDRFANAKKIGAVDGDVLILHGDRDNVVSLANARRLHAARPRSTLAIVPGAGHELAYSDTAQGLIANWVKRLPD